MASKKVAKKSEKMPIKPKKAVKPEKTVKGGKASGSAKVPAKSQAAKIRGYDHIVKQAVFILDS